MMLEKGMQLWMLWWDAIWLLRPAFSRLRTFLWFATAAAGLAARTDLLGVTSIVRALTLKPALYDKLLDHFHSGAVKLDRLTALWAQAALRLFPEPLCLNGRRVLVGDGIKIPKRGKKMPAVKLLHQQSGTNKAEYIMGHSLQAVSILVNAADSVFAVPLAARIHEGLVWSNRDRRTLLDKMLALLRIVALQDPFYFVADAYYAAGKIVCGLLAQNNHLVTRAKANAVAYAPVAHQGPKRRGRPRLYGQKIKLKSLFKDLDAMQSAPSPVYGEKKVTIQYRACDLLWRPAARLVRFVLVIHPTRGSLLLMGTDLSLSPIDIIPLYGLRFKIEHGFKQAVNVVGAFGYHFWMLDAGYAKTSPQQRQSASASQNLRLSNPHQTQDAGLPCIHPSRCRLSGPPAVPRRRRPRARLEIIRLLAAHHSTRHPSLRARRRSGAAPQPAGISLECR